MQTNREKYTTAKEISVAFKKYCESRDCDSCPLHDDVLNNSIECEFSWLDLPADSAVPAFCPNCGFKSEKVRDRQYDVIVCPMCGKRTRIAHDSNDSNNANEVR